MDVEEFTQQLNKAHDLMSKERYKESIIILEKLKQLDKEMNIEYNLAHRLYQLHSNAHSLYNQQVILKNINELSKNIEGISISTLNRKLKEEDQLDITEDIILREIELLIETLKKNESSINTNFGINNLVKNIEMDYFHSKNDICNLIRSSLDIPVDDYNFIKDKEMFPSHSFCPNSPFFSGCIRISMSKKK